MFVHAVRKGRLDLVLLIYVCISINSTDCGFLKCSVQTVLEQIAVRAWEVSHFFVLLYDFILSHEIPLRGFPFFKASVVQLNPSQMNPSYERMIDLRHLRLNRC